MLMLDEQNPFQGLGRMKEKEKILLFLSGRFGVKKIIVTWNIP
jgi:hypothetical protein